MSVLFVSFGLGSGYGYARYGSHLVSVQGVAITALSQEAISYLYAVVRKEYGIDRPVVTYDILPSADDHPSEVPPYLYAYGSAVEYSPQSSGIRSGTIPMKRPILTLADLRAAEELIRSEAGGTVCHFTMLKPVMPDGASKH